MNFLKKKKSALHSAFSNFCLMTQKFIEPVYLSIILLKRISSLNKYEAKNGKNISDSP